MPAKLPAKGAAQPTQQAGRRVALRKQDRAPGGIHHEARIEGQLSGVWGGLAAIVFLLLLGVIFVLGLLTLTVVLWLALGAVLLAIITACLRLLSGTSKIH
jgi:hypothetical protein